MPKGLGKILYIINNNILLGLQSKVLRPEDLPALETNSPQNVSRLVGDGQQEQPQNEEFLSTRFSTAAVTEPTQSPIEQDMAA